MHTLRTYQKDLVQGLRQSFLNGNKRVMLCAPTGAGKTRIFCAMVRMHLEKSKRHKALIVTHRVELLKQAGKDFENIQEIKANHEPDLTKPLIVASIETLYKRIERYHNYLQTLTMIILDEAHVQNFNKLFPHLSDRTFVIGASATPLRTSKQDPLDSFYTDMVQQVDTPDLIELGFLSKAKTYGVDIDLKGVKKRGEDYDPDQMAKKYSETKVYEGVLENYKKICPGTKAILFASNVESSQEMCLKFNLAGIPARHLDSLNVSDKEREEILKWFKETPNGILCNIGILVAGFDEPSIRTVILYCATTSIIKFCQMVGRGSRTIPGVKDEFFLLDLGNNVKTHGFWQMPRTWSLSKPPKREKLGPAPVKICPGCHAMLPVSAPTCTYCNYVFPVKAETKNEFAELKLLTPPQIWASSKGKDIPTKAKMAKEKLIKPMRVLHELTTLEEGIEFCKEMGYKSTFPYVNRNRFKCFESL